jgi:hypothetical protein
MRLIASGVSTTVMRRAMNPIHTLKILPLYTVSKGKKVTLSL